MSYSIYPESVTGLWRFDHSIWFVDAAYYDAHDDEWANSMMPGATILGQPLLYILHAHIPPSIHASLHDLKLIRCLAISGSGQLGCCYIESKSFMVGTLIAPAHNS
jgi:hypothetical protein